MSERPGRFEDRVRASRNAFGERRQTSLQAELDRLSTLADVSLVDVWKSRSTGHGVDPVRKAAGQLLSERHADLAGEVVMAHPVASSLDPIGLIAALARAIPDEARKLEVNPRLNVREALRAALAKRLDRHPLVREKRASLPVQAPAASAPKAESFRSLLRRALSGQADAREAIRALHQGDIDAALEPYTKHPDFETYKARALRAVESTIDGCDAFTATSTFRTTLRRNLPEFLETAR